MKEQTLLLTAVATFALATISNAATEINISADTANSTNSGVGGFSTDIANTLDDTFVYNPDNPFAIDQPNQAYGTGGQGFHTVKVDASATLSYTLDTAFTTSAGSEIYVDLWGRDILTNRDDDFDIILYNGDYSTVVASELNFAIPVSTVGRVTFDGLSDGTTFDRFQIVLNISDGTSANQAYLAEVRIATIPEPSTFALLAGVTGLIGVMVRRR